MSQNMNCFTQPSIDERNNFINEITCSLKCLFNHFYSLILEDLNGSCCCFKLSVVNFFSIAFVKPAGFIFLGIYTCNFSQSFLSSFGNITVKVIPLLRPQEIIRDPIETVISCPATRSLECCTHRMENYVVYFFSYDPNMPLPIRAGK